LGGERILRETGSISNFRLDFKMIKIINLTKKFGHLIAVDNLNLEIPPGEIFGFLGPNGAGKTTTIRILTGLVKPTSGQALVGGYDVQKEPERAKKIIGLVPDQPFLYQKLTGGEFLNFVADLYEVPLQLKERRIRELLYLFEMNEWKDILIEEYSLGMQRKLVMASVLLHNPQVIFLDEPLVGLDPKAGRLIKRIFQELSQRKVTIFMSTHTLEIAEKLCHRIGIIQDGRLVALGTNEELRRKAEREGEMAKRAGLEDIFLQLTGGPEYEELLKYLE
jgi:ABC-2 type transport system ATP-binding protein